MDRIFLALAALALLGAIAAQDWLVPTLRNETVSSGLDGPKHGLLDAAYLVLAVALVLGFRAHPLTEAFAIITAIALVLSGVANTAWRWTDRVTGGKHELWHLRFTIVIFAAAAAVEVTADVGRGALWAVSAAGALVPAAVWGLTQRTDYAEKVGVLLLCFWLIVWALTGP